MELDVDVLDVLDVLEVIEIVVDEVVLEFEIDVEVIDMEVVLLVEVELVVILCVDVVVVVTTVVVLLVVAAKEPKSLNFHTFRNVPLSPWLGYFVFGFQRPQPEVNICKILQKHHGRCAKSIGCKCFWRRKT